MDAKPHDTSSHPIAEVRFFLDRGRGGVDWGGKEGRAEKKSFMTLLVLDVCMTSETSALFNVWTVFCSSNVIFSAVDPNSVEESRTGIEGPRGEEASG